MHSKVVIRLSVNRLPVKLPITGFDFQLPITDYRFTDTFLHVMQFSASASSTLDPEIPSPSDGSVPLAFDCRVCSPRRVAAAGKGGEGKRCELDGRREA